MDLRHYDFLDFGASKGGCIDFATAQLGGRRGLGVDVDPKKVEAMRSLGYDCIVGDVADLDLPPKSVRFVTMSHFLEHLPDFATVRKAVQSAAKVATHFLFIQGPFFDADDRLREHGLKFFWSDWSGHKCHLTTDQLVATLENLGLTDYVALARVPVESSLDAAIHPLASPRNQHHYAPGEHAPKPGRGVRAAALSRDGLPRALAALLRLKRIVRARRGCVFLRGSLPFE